MAKKKVKREFGSGAYRDTDDTKLQFRRCLSHRVLISFAEFMRKHNTMADGTRRDEENWKKGFPQESFMDSKFRHFMTTWKTYEEFEAIEVLIESLNAELFNTMGWLDLLLRPGMTIDKFRKTVEGIENLGKESNHTALLNNIAEEIANMSEEDFTSAINRLGTLTNKTQDAYEGMRNLNKKPKKIHLFNPAMESITNKSLCGQFITNNTLTTFTQSDVTCGKCNRILYR